MNDIYKLYSNDNEIIYDINYILSRMGNNIDTAELYYWTNGIDDGNGNITDEWIELILVLKKETETNTLMIEIIKIATAQYGFDDIAIEAKRISRIIKKNFPQINLKTNLRRFRW